MAISQKDIKLLWGRSGNRCAVCRVELTQDGSSQTASFTLGEQAHIVGEKDGAARGISILSPEERNTYHNLILLCPNHHSEIDKNEDDWPVEKLHSIKSSHELWVSETLSDVVDSFKVAKQVSVTSIIDAAVSHCRLENWKSWTSFAIDSDPRWEKELPNEAFEFRQKVIAAIWPDDFQELRAATETLSINFNIAAQTFMEHAELRGDTWYPHKFYKAYGWNDNYQEDVERYRQWARDCCSTIRETTKAANWFADVVRRDINPMFFAEHGKFLVLEGDVLRYEARLLEYTDEERAALPESLLS